MLDWLFSKAFAGAVPALILLATVMAYMSLVQDGVQTVELDRTCDLIADTVTDVSSGTGFLWRNVTFDDSGQTIPRMIGYQPYDIHLAMNTVWLQRENVRVSRDVPTHVHLWDPTDELTDEQLRGIENVPWDDLNRTDADHDRIDTASDELDHGLTVRGLELLVSGRRVHHTFCFARSIAVV